MRVCIHRGAREIGGSCVEVEHEDKRLVLDVGRPLDSGMDEELPLPPVAGLASGDPDLVGVIVSHGHPDHWGLVPAVASTVSVYLGEATQRILKEAMFFSPAGADLRATGYLRDREPLQLGPFTVTPFLVDHSAFGAYALLVEAGGKRLLYSGDFRGHGRKAGVFRRLLADPPANVDALLLEGTNIGHGRAATGSLSETEVEEHCVELFASTRGMVLAAYSGQNLDRVVTMHRAAQRSGRTLVLDLYTAAITAAAGRDTIPQGDWGSVHVFVPLSQRVRVKQAREFERVADVRARRLFPEDLAGRADELVMTFRASMTRDLEQARCLDGARAVWSMWPGYLDQQSGVRLRTWLERRQIPLSFAHASGHARVQDLQQLASAVGARQVVPIHTREPERYRELFEHVMPRDDGEWWDA